MLNAIGNGWAALISRSRTEEQKRIYQGMLTPKIYGVRAYSEPENGFPISATAVKGQDGELCPQRFKIGLAG